MSLKEYKRKRDFSKTPEPQARSAKGRSGRRFVVQKHDASRLHYDFRLQIGDALASWAVPKGPSMNPGDKRLAVHVEDHPLEYGDFEGVIPEGQYGGGVVMVWDRGTWTPDEDDPAKALKRGKLSFTLDGERLRGAWTLTRMRGGKQDNDGDHWLLIKKADEAAQKRSDVLSKQTTSVKTGRSLEEIARDEDAVWENGQATSPRKTKPSTKKRSKKASRDSTTSKAKSIDPSMITGARKAPLPRDISPQLCTLTDAAPKGDDWLHEIKFDGYRLIARLKNGRAQLMTRANKDWTRKFGPIAEAIEALPVDSAILDGEACILDRHGRTSFQQLQQGLKSRKFENLVFFVFDLLYLDGFDLTAAPLLERKQLLNGIVPATNEGVLRYSDHVRGGGPAVQENACELALEGIISKFASAPYTQGRSRTWLKIKCSRRQEFVVIGWTPPSGSRKHFGALLLGAYDGDGRLVYTGRVGTGFDSALLKDIGARLRALERKTCPADDAPTRAESRGVHWTRPELVAEVEFTEWTDDGRLRHPSFQGLREDKEAAAVKVESPKHVDEAQRQAERAATGTGAQNGKVKSGGRAAGSASSRNGKARSGAGKAQSGEAMVAGVRISNPDRVLYPDQGLTKLELAKYYEAIAELILPFVVNRPLSTVRCPKGRSEKCFFQKHLGETFGDPVKSIRVREKDGPADYICIDSVQGLIALVQFGVLELHPWGSSGVDVEKPDLLTFDLDPGEGVGFDAVKEAAARVRQELDEFGLESFLKTSGGKGLHVVAPLGRKAGWDEAKEFCAAVAQRISKDEPDRYLATMSKQKRRGKIFVDYLRNGRGATSVAPYSTRARQGAPISMPLEWDELEALQSAAQFTVENSGEHIAKRSRDPWEDFFKKRQQLTATRLKKAGVMS